MRVSASAAALRMARLRPVALVALAGSLAVVACGDGSTTAGGGAAAGSLSAAAERGRRIASDSGCAACHGTGWQGGAGPALVGLAGSTITLDDGTTLVADRDYLTRAIAEPSADVVGTFSMTMPPNGLDDAEVADIVTFLTEIGVAGR